MSEPLVLQGPEAEAYLERARRLLAVARPGTLYPPGPALDAFWSLLRERSPAAPHVELDARSGLPSIAELARVRADRELAEELLRDHGELLPDRARYHRLARAAVLPELSRVEAKLVTKLSGGARFLVVHDLLDPPSGAQVRFTWHLREQGTHHVALVRGDLASPTPEFMNAIERCAGADVELGLLVLSELPGVTVEEGVRAQLGPLHSRLLPAPGPLAAAVGDGALLHLTLERAGPSVPKDAWADPFGTAYREGLGHGAREAVARRRAELGYRVSKERRLICTPEVEPAVRAALREAGLRLVVRSR